VLNALLTVLVHMGVGGFNSFDGLRLLSLHFNKFSLGLGEDGLGSPQGDGLDEVFLLGVDLLWRESVLGRITEALLGLSIGGIDIVEGSPVTAD